MKIQDIISSALSLAEIHAPQLVKDLTQLRDITAQHGFKVVVLGDFKAGKSTLINRLFLKDSLLPVDHREATAVPTYVRNGDPCMQVWQRESDGSETLVSETHNISDALIADTVTASTPEARAEKAERFSRVVICKPHILPEGITLVDTPGLNSTNTRIIVGTLAEARNADAVLYVLRSRQLSAQECQRISELAGNQRNKLPVHVILTISDMSAPDQVQNIREEVEAQLRLNGVVVRVSVFPLSGEDFSIGSIGDKIKTDYGDWDCGFGRKDTALKVETDSSSLVTELLEFFNGEVRRGRDARLCREMLPLLQSLTRAIESRLALAGRSEEDIQNISEQMEDKRREYLRLVKNMLMDVRVAQQRFANGVENHLNEIREAYINEIEKQEDVSGVMKLLNDWRNSMPERLQRMMELAHLDLQRDLSDISDKYRVEFENSLKFDNSVDVDFGSFINVLSKVPSWIITVSDYLIFSWVGPFGIIGDSILRFLVGRIPIIGDLMPSNLLKSTAIKVAVSKITEVISDIKTSTRKRIDEAFAQMQKKLEKDLEQRDVFNELDAVLADARKSVLTADQVAELKAAAAQVQQWGAEL